MRILIDAHMLGERETGNETYVRGLLAGLSEIDGVEVAAAIVAGRDDLPADLRVVRLGLGHGNSWRRLALDLPRLARAWRADVVHTTYVAPFRSPCPIALSVHDVSFCRYPQYFSRRDRLLFATLFPSSLRRASAILTLSAHGRDELRAFYPHVRAPMHVVPAAAGSHFHPLPAEAAERIARQHGARPPFLLAVGSLQPRKNLSRLIEAFAPVRHQHPDLQLVIVGPRGLGADRVHEMVAASGLAGAVAMPGYVGDSELAALYNASLALVYPSVYEGFGLPVVEAMACGRPVICGNTSSLPEVAGQAALLVNPFDTAALRDAMMAVVTNRELAMTLAARGLDQARRFSWRRTAGLAVEAYQAALAAERR